VTGGKRHSLGPTSGAVERCVHDARRRSSSQAGRSRDDRAGDPADAGRDRPLPGRVQSGSLPETVCAPRVEALGKKLSGLEARQQKLTIEDDADFAPPSEDELAALATEVRHCHRERDTRQKKALFQAYVNEINVAGRGEIYPSFYAPTSRFHHRRTQCPRQESNLRTRFRKRRAKSLICRQNAGRTTPARQYARQCENKARGRSSSSDRRPLPPLTLTGFEDEQEVAQRNRFGGRLRQ